MTTANHSTNQAPHGLGNLGQIIADQEQCNLVHCETHQKGNYAPKTNTREQAAEVIDRLDGANLTATVKALNGLTRGSYRVTIKQDAEYNEAQVRLWENTIKDPIATGFIDRGHTNESRFEAAAEVRGIVRAYLCR